MYSQLLELVKQFFLLVLSLKHQEFINIYTQTDNKSVTVTLFKIIDQRATATEGAC